MLILAGEGGMTGANFSSKGDIHRICELGKSLWCCIPTEIPPHPCTILFAETLTMSVVPLHNTVHM